MQFIGYKNCGTCKKAKKYLSDKGMAFEYREITEDPLSIEEITRIFMESGLPIQKFLNTSGGVYRELNMKEKIKELSDEAVLEFLSKYPMLIKRPILLNENKIMVGFKEQEWDKILK